MTFFKDPLFAFVTLQAAGYAGYGGAEIGEILSTIRRIPDGDEYCWHREWKASAERLFALGENAACGGHRVSAREAYLRASSYYRLADYFRRDDPSNDPEIANLADHATRAFLKAADLFDTPVHDLRIPYEGATLRAYLFLADQGGTRRPTLVYTNGFEATREDGWFVVAAAAVRRGYHALVFDGPGQGATIREERMPYRPDWEHVIGSVLNHLSARPEIDDDRFILCGFGLGALLAARAAAFEKRPAAMILNDGMFDFGQTMTLPMPAFLQRWLDAGHDRLFTRAATMLMRTSTPFRWAARHGQWTFGVATIADFVRTTKAYSLRGIASQIGCPTLVMEGDEDPLLHGQARRVAESLTCLVDHVILRSSDGAGAHRHMGSLQLAHQVMFDWLDETLAFAGRPCATHDRALSGADKVS